MVSKQIIFNEEARQALLRGIDKVANIVKVTLGPKGRTVILDRSPSPLVSNDGVTIAKEIELKDKFENMGAKLIREVASQTQDKAGDGTTTATVLAQLMISEGLKNIAAGSNPVEMKAGIEEAMEKVGNKGVITVEESKSIDTYLELVEGMQFDKGYLSPYMMTNQEKMEASYEDPYILITDRSISAVKEIVPVLENVAQEGKPLIIIAEDVEGEALTMLVLNILRGALKVCAVKSPGFGDEKKEL